MMSLRHYTTRSGELRVYEYAPYEHALPEPDYAVDACRRVLRQTKSLHLIGKARWRSGGRQSRSFQNVTVQQLIRSGEAVRCGDVVLNADNRSGI